MKITFDLITETAACNYCMDYNTVNVKQFHGLIYILQPTVSTRLIADVLTCQLFITQILLRCVTWRSAAG